MTDPTDNLYQTLLAGRRRVEQYQGQGIGEQNTKAILIEPVLEALGWDLRDLDEVQREFKRRSMENPVDYALMLLRQPRLFVEAKSLDGNLNDPKWTGQIMGYAAVAGVEWVVLTDGNEYRIYNSHVTVPVEEKLFRSVRLSDDLSAVADTLSLLSKPRMSENLIQSLWRAHYIDRQIQQAIRVLLSPEPDPAFIRLIRRHVPELQPSDIRAGLARAQVQFDFPEPLSAEGLPSDTNGDAPGTHDRQRRERNPEQSAGTPWRHVTVSDLIASGLLTPPVDLRKRYKGHDLAARLEADGQVSFGGKRYDSLSTAAGMARKSIIGSPEGRSYPQTNGWVFWQFRDGDGEYREIDTLRQRFHASRPT